MQATLTFTLPEEAHDHDMAVHAQALADVMAEVREWLRQERKYSHLSPEADAFAEKAWSQLHDSLAAHDVARFIL